jgi:hypothetical protein
LYLSFRLIILVVEVSNVLLNLAFSNQQILNCAFDLIEMRIKFSLYGRMRLFDGLDVMVLVFALINGELP